MHNKVGGYREILPYFQLEYDKIIISFIYLFIVLFNLFVYLFSGLFVLEIVFGGEELTL